MFGGAPDFIGVEPGWTLDLWGHDFLHLVFYNIEQQVAFGRDEPLRGKPEFDSCGFFCLANVIQGWWITVWFHRR